MASTNTHTYITVKAENNVDFLCPLDVQRTAGAGNVPARDDCFEKDVAERYSGNLVIVS